MKADVQSLARFLAPQFHLIDCSKVTAEEAAYPCPKEAYRVYILTRDDDAIILGHGRWDRTRVIFDDLTHYTGTHCKSGLLRLYNIYDLSLVIKPEIRRYVIICNSKAEAEELEHKLHKEFGGNVSEVPQYLFDFILRDFPAGSTEGTLVKMAFQSNFSPLTDLTKWRRKGLIPDDSVWENLVKLLYL